MYFRDIFEYLDNNGYPKCCKQLIMALASGSRKKMDKGTFDSQTDTRYCKQAGFVRLTNEGVIELTKKAKKLIW